MRSPELLQTASSFSFSSDLVKGVRRMELSVGRGVHARERPVASPTSRLQSRAWQKGETALSIGCLYYLD